MSSKGTIKIINATDSHVPAITSIYNEVIETTTAVYSEEAVSADNRQAWLSERLNEGFPVIVAVDGSDCLGFGSFGHFRTWPCYSQTVEHSVHILADARGRRIGRLLVEELIRRAQGLNKHVMIAGIDADNEASLRLHGSLGFKEVGRFQEVGYKFGRWLDLTFMQKVV